MKTINVQLPNLAMWQNFLYSAHPNHWKLYTAYTLATLLIILIIIKSYTITVDFFPEQSKEIQHNQLNNKVEVEGLPDLAQYHLFGILPPEKVVTDGLPNTVLNLSLVGVFKAIPAQNSQAVIAVPGGQEKLYRVGDKVPGGALVYQILAYSIVIEHNGQLEILPLPKDKVKFDNRQIQVNNKKEKGIIL